MTCAAFVGHACHLSVISSNPPELGVEQFAMIASPIGHCGSAVQPLCLCGVSRMKFVMSSRPEARLLYPTQCRKPRTICIRATLEKICNIPLNEEKMLRHRHGQTTTTIARCGTVSWRTSANCRVAEGDSIEAGAADREGGRDCLLWTLVALRSASAS